MPKVKAPSKLPDETLVATRDNKRRRLCARISELYSIFALHVIITEAEGF